MFDAKRNKDLPPLYDASFEHDSCGIGACANIKGIKSHQVVIDALSIVENLEHRAGKDGDGKTGDGVGIMTQIPHEFFLKAAKGIGMELPGEREYGVGMFFFPIDEFAKTRSKKMFEVVCEKYKLEILGWRQVPVDKKVLGKRALECMPDICQVFIKKPQNVEKGLDFDRMLYVTRRIFEQSSDNTYISSLSSRTIVYKGMFLVGQLRTFFKDLQDKEYKSAIALVHSRFSTNTTPSWERAHPYRMLVHNGEINTIKGNADKMLAREENMESEHLKDVFTDVLPVIHASGSDSAMLDNTIEFLMMSGMELPLAMMITIPEPWDNNHTMSRQVRDFYQYYATMMEPWDGPASILFSDGDIMGAILDRNGLRPSRYIITSDDRVVLSSEVGALDFDESTIVKKGRLHPGKMLVIDTKEQRVIHDEEIKRRYALANNFGEWIDRNMVKLHDLKIPNIRPEVFSEERRSRLQRAFGYTYEDVTKEILPMARDGVEPTNAMGVDTPLPVLSGVYHPLFDSFKQLFAQVTNPPIDVIREEIVSSTTVYVGRDGNILEQLPKNCTMLKVNNPILSDTDLLKIRHMKKDGFKVSVVPITYYKNTSLKKAIERLYMEADRCFANGANVIILSDRGVDDNHLAIPSLLAVSGLQQHFVVTKKRTSVAIILESAEPKNVHDFATLIGYGACAVNPYLAHECIRELIDNGMLDKDYYAAMDDYDHAIMHGILKIASKMGISTIQSYQGSKIFEAVGIDTSVVEEYFTGTVSRIGGMKLSDIEKNIDKMHTMAFDPLGLAHDLTLESYGYHKSRAGKEEHMYDPAVIHMLQQSVRTGDYGLFKKYTKMVDESSVKNLRGLMEFNFPKKGIPLSKVEPISEIVKRFKTGAMSYGSISKEAHETLAIAMNRLKGKSNTGEGGEDEERLLPDANGDNRCSAIKQVASGRFGVTSEYLNSAKEIQIKMAQGAKPGEGGHLPAGKVYPWIAKTRHSTPGVALISPPPHHDIYSIEDLAELIYDLKNANRKANISVKLVSEAGVGTVAAGVAKAGAQVVLISGYDGGTGAAPNSSIHNAGLPWEIGLAETHQTLIMNGLRDKVRIETDGKLMSGRDVAIAAILGAEEFGFATAPLVAMGCVMMRVCNLDTCPVGIATQNPELRKRFKGKPEHVENFMIFIAKQLREIMAKLGVATVDELVGRTDLIKAKSNLKGAAATIDLSAILSDVYAKERTVFNPAHVYNFQLEKTADEKKLLPSFSKGSIIKSLEVKNTDRAFGTILGSEISRQHTKGGEIKPFSVECSGSGGQSFGAFIPKGLSILLTGDTNDYFGKGLSGGTLIVKTPDQATYRQDENIIIGNVALYGATSGKAFINGVAGERFCVRNSGAKAVVEGVGDHGCEYMTGGMAVIIGEVGKNFAAGMSGGIAYVLDEEGDLYTKVNKDMVSMNEVTDKYDVAELKGLITEHFENTGSMKAKEILNDFSEYLPKFKKIIPQDYERMLHLIASMEEKGLDPDTARVEAFFEGRREQ